jgi:zinc transport system substrate-binding protein
MRLALAIIALLVALAASACGGGGASSRGKVVASFYPLAWAAEQVEKPGGSGKVLNLTPPGAEPHDFELSPRTVEDILGAKLVVYAGGGFQPAVEAAVANRDGPSLDVLRSGEDPHLWLDPVRFAAVVQAIARELGRPSAARPVVKELDALDGEYRQGLASCDRRTIVTTHAAFGRLAARYGLEDIALAGRSPEAEPGPRDLERIVREIRASGATTVFTEPLVSPRLAEAVAREAGIGVATLDPIEGLSQARLDAGESYLSVMRTNLATLERALGCR